MGKVLRRMLPIALGVHFEGQRGLLADDERNMALVVVEVGFEAGDGVALGELNYGHVHAD